MSSIIAHRVTAAGTARGAGCAPTLTGVTDSLCDRRPEPTLERLLADLVPPPRFAQARQIGRAHV